MTVMKQLLNRAFLLGISSLLLIGCQSSHRVPPQSKAATAPSTVMDPPAEGFDEGAVEEDSEPFSQGNPESLARFAAGIAYALNDKSDQALTQFYQSALADPTNEPLVLEVSKDLLSKKQTQKAIDLLSKSAARHDSSPIVLGWLAQAYLQGGQTNQAINIARTAVQKAPSAIEGYQSLFLTYLKAGKYPEALNTLSQASRKVNADPESLLSLAELYGTYLKTRPGDEKMVKPQALKVLARIERMKLDTERLQLGLAQAYEQVDEPSKAADMYLKILAADPKSSAKRDALREKLANLYLLNQDKKRAAEQLQAMVRDNPTRYPQAWYLLGTLAGDVKEYESAVNFFQKALLLDPNMEQAYYEMALAQIDLKKNGDALRTLEKAREKFPNTFIGEFFSGVAYTRLKSYSEAMKHLTAAEVIGAASEPKRLNQQFYFQIGAAAERNHQISEAVEYFEKCLKIAPDFYEAVNYLAYMWAERGENLPHAREMIQKAVKAEPKNAAFLDSMGWVLFKQNQAAEALPWLLKAVTYSEEPDATLFDHLGDVYQALKQPEKAREAWKKSLAIESNEEISKKLTQAGGGS